MKAGVVIAILLIIAALFAGWQYLRWNQCVEKRLATSCCGPSPSSSCTGPNAAAFGYGTAGSDICRSVVAEIQSKCFPAP